MLVSCLPLLQDDAALLMFKRALAGPNCTQAPSLCQLLDSWQPYTAPCSAPDCMPCLQTNTTACSAAGSSMTHCRWSFIGCSQGRVSQLVLGESHILEVHLYMVPLGALPGGECMQTTDSSSYCATSESDKLPELTQQHSRLSDMSSIA
jgi:hypothetical protein